MDGYLSVPIYHLTSKSAYVRSDSGSVLVLVLVFRFGGLPVGRLAGGWADSGMEWGGVSDSDSDSRHAAGGETLDAVSFYC